MPDRVLNTCEPVGAIMPGNETSYIGVGDEEVQTYFNLCTDAIANILDFHRCFQRLCPVRMEAFLLSGPSVIYL